MVIKMKLSEIEEKVKRLEGMKIVGVDNVLGYVRWKCLKCRKCEDELKWRVVIREGKNGIDLWGLECEEVGERVIRRYGKK